MEYPIKKVFNPTKEDFSTTYDIHGTGEPERYVVHSLELEEFPAPVADHIANHLAYKIGSERSGRSNFQDEFAKALLEVQHNG